MKVHHINSISTCPLGGALMDGFTPTLFERGLLTNHCLLVESDKSGLILIDTGLGLQDVAHPHSRLSEFFLSLVSPDFREEMTAVRQIEKLGFKAEDVRHIVLTHLDFDHAGGLDDFPAAQVHLLHSESENALAQKTWMDRQRFRPQQWGSKKRWRTYQAGEGETWFGFDRVHGLHGLPEDIALIPLIGHTLGHCGVAVRSGGRWLFLTGDAYFYREEMNCAHPHCTPGLKFYQLMLDKDRKARIWNQERLLDLKKNHSDKITIFCSHDAVEFENLADHPATQPLMNLKKSVREPKFPYAKKITALE